MEQSNIDLAHAMSGDKAAEKRFLTAKQYSDSRDHFIVQYGAILSLLRDAPQLPPKRIRYLFEQTSLLKTDLKKYDHAFDIARGARHLLIAGHADEALTMLGDLFSNSDFLSLDAAQSKRLVLIGFNSLFHWRNFV